MSQQADDSNPLKGVLILHALLPYGEAFMRGVAAANGIHLIDEGPLTQGEAELVATLAALTQRCTFCTGGHCAISAARLNLSYGQVQDLLNDYKSSEQLSNEMKEILSFVEQIAMGGDVARLWPEYATRVPREKLAHALHVCRLFILQATLVNDYSAMTGAQASGDPAFYEGVAAHFANGGTYSSMLEAYIASKQETKE